MESNKAKMYRAAVRRRAKGRSPGVQFPQSSGGERNAKWAVVAAGALILALVAFVSGVQMGKALTEMKHTGESSPRAKAKGPQEVPFYSEAGKKNSRPSMGGKMATSDVLNSRKEKGPQPSLSKETEAEEKISPPSGETAASATISEKKAALPPKAKFTLQVAAFNTQEEAQELVDQLQKKGYSAYQITGSAAAKGTLHRVRVGHFQSLQEARQFALVFEKKEKIKTIIASVQ